MSKRPKDPSSYALALRELAQKLAKSKLGSREEIANAAKRTSLSKTHIGQMVYQGKGGMDAWAELLFTLYDLTPAQIEGLFHLAIKSLQRHSDFGEQTQPRKVLSNLPEEKMWFWLSLIMASEGIKPSFTIKKNKK